MTNDLIGIVENEREEEVLRREAVEALGLINEEASIYRLKEVLTSESPLPGGLRVALLVTLWPEFVTPSNLVLVAQRMGTEVQSGSFDYIISYRVAPNLDREAVAAVLIEAAKTIETGQASAGIHAMAMSLLQRAWSLFDTPSVPLAVAGLLHYYFRHNHADHHAMLALSEKDDWLVSQEKRRQLLTAPVPLLQEDQLDADCYFHGGVPFGCILVSAGTSA